MNKMIEVTVLTLLLTACGSSTPSAEQKQTEGREETRGIRNADNIGVSGSAIANKVDGALSANEEAARKIREQEQLQSQSAPTPPP